MRLQQFIPRSESMAVFALAMACYAYFLSGLVNAVIRTFHAAVHPVSLLPDSLYWFTILIDTLLIAGIFEALRWLRLSTWLQVVIVCILLSGSRAFSNPPFRCLLFR